MNPLIPAVVGPVVCLLAMAVALLVTSMREWSR